MMPTGLMGVVGLEPHHSGERGQWNHHDCGGEHQREYAECAGGAQVRDDHGEHGELEHHQGDATADEDHADVLRG